MLIIFLKVERCPPLAMVYATYSEWPYGYAKYCTLSVQPQYMAIF